MKARIMGLLGIRYTLEIESPFAASGGWLFSACGEWLAWLWSVKIGYFHE